MPYVPAAGDIVWVNLSPTKGHEQRGHRPALVLSPERYNAKTGLALVCPITSQVKGYPFEVALNFEGRRGVVLADQIKSIDWRARKVKYAEASLPQIIPLVKQIAITLLD